jgi:hypothetical protein
MYVFHSVHPFFGLDPKKERDINLRWTTPQENNSDWISTIKILLRPVVLFI